MKPTPLCFALFTGASLLAAVSTYAARGAAAAPPPPVELKFDFSSGPAKDGFTRVVPETAYSTDTDYGYEPGTPVTAGDNGNNTTSDHPILFSAKVPEGNYNVTVTLGDSANATTTTIKAESGRLMAEKITTNPGEIVTRTFTTNVRTPQLPPVPANAPGGNIVREDQFDAGNSRDWDDKLTIEINSPRAALRSIEISRVNDAPTIFIAGDSTVTDRDGGADVSWGQLLPRFFKPGIAVSNQAQSGETLKSFANALRLDKILSQMKRGDYLFIQFAHNDEKSSWPQTYVEASTTFKAYLNVYIAEARLRGATPVLVTAMNRISFNGAGQNTNSHGGYPDAMRQLAKEDNVALIDLNAMSESFYDTMGPAAKAEISADGTHTVLYGGYELTKCVVMGIKQNIPDLAKYIVDDFTDFDPAHPDPFASFDLTASFAGGGAKASAGAAASGSGGRRGGRAGQGGAAGANSPAASTSATTGVPAGDPGPGPL
ncbi:MAG TPA: rhamnogalacturonan acetylesterase [Opitutales bacterium]|nr:rhamnogalacturonan acetylesterase [Opitutales bacterium]